METPFLYLSMWAAIYFSKRDNEAYGVGADQADPKKRCILLAHESPSSTCDDSTSVICDTVTLKRSGNIFAHSPYCVVCSVYKRMCSFTIDEEIILLQLQHSNCERIYVNSNNK